MAGNESFGFDPDDLDRLMRGASEQLRGALGNLGWMFEGAGGRAGRPAGFPDPRRHPRPAPERETTGDAGDGVWAIYTVAVDGGAHVEQVFATELDALRANRHNTDPGRRVRFLPYGIAVSALDEGDEPPADEPPATDLPAADPTAADPAREDRPGGD